MTGTRWMMAVALGTALTAEASGQVVYLPPPVIGVPVVVPGIGFTYNSRRLNVGGFVPFGFPYYYPGYYPGYPLLMGAVENRTTLQIINPPGMAPTRVLGPPPVDVSGIDLDRESPDKIWGRKPGSSKIVAAKEQKAEVVRKEEPKQVKIPDRPPPPAKEAPPDQKRLIDNGITAFRNGEYGIAILRFRLFADADPPVPRAMFLQGQAYIAVGKYREAAHILQEALKRQPDWLQSGFRPRAELYGNDDERWKQHVNRLEQAQRLAPGDADYLFLLGYMSWFDGEREAAAAYFRQSRAVARDPQWADLFLKAVK